MALIATPGALDANSYVTVAQATILLAGRLGTDAWNTATLLAREQSLVWATRLLDEQAQWTVTPTTTTQRLWWPAIGTTDVRGNAISSSTIPVWLEQATAEYALALLEWHGQQPAVEPAVSRMKIGSVEFDMPPRTDVAPFLSLPVNVQRLIALFARPLGTGMTRVLRV